MSQTLFEKLKKISAEKPGRELTSQIAEPYIQEIEDCMDDNQLKNCFNHSEIHPLFWHYILARYLQNEPH